MTAAPGPRSRRPRAAANYGPQRGTTYLIHIDPPYKHARHYKGWTDRPVEQRLADHLAGRGALLTRLAVRAGSRLTLARVWPNTTKDREDSIKRQDGKRMCPECGVKPAAPRLASDKPPEPDDRRPPWQYERDGEWADDGTPIIYDPSQTYAQARAEAAQHPVVLSAEDREELAALDDLQRQWTSQEEQVGLKDAVARAADAIRGQREAHQRRVANREADRLWAIADELDRQMGRRPGYAHELTAGRAARIRARIGVDLAVDAHIEAIPRAEGQPLEHWAITPDDVAQAGREPMLQGAELDAEIDRLAGAFPEPGGDASAQTDPSPEEMLAFEQAERARWAQVDRDAEYLARHAAQYYGPQMADLLGIEPVDTVQVPGPEPGDDAATWSPALEDEQPRYEPAQQIVGLSALEAAASLAETTRGLERAALAREHIAHAGHDDAAVQTERARAAEMREARVAAEADAYEIAGKLHELDGSSSASEPQAEPMDRIAPEAGHSPTPAPVAAAQPSETAHTDPVLAERGWQADSHGVYARNPGAEAPGARRELAGYEADSPDHQYGSPQCAEADPEGAHFGRGPGEPMDTGRWPVLQADYGRMYIGPQYQAEAEAV
jgi:hypothetical protein